MKTSLRIAALSLVALLQACTPGQSAFAAAITLNPVAIAHGVKAGLMQQRGFHRVVYAAELLGATISLGADGGSTEYALAHSRLWETSCSCYVQVAHESDPLFLSRGTQNLSQLKLWVWKGALAAAPFALSWASHKFAPESNTLDASLVGLIGVADTYYLKAAINNLKVAAQIQAQNRALGH